jgi:hypothetical protein
MPLQNGPSHAAFVANIKELVKAGHPVKQALAIAYKKKREKTGKKG